MLIQSDALKIPLPDKSVDTICTSPPYWTLRDYGLGDAGIGLESTLDEYISVMLEVGREMWRVLRAAGTLWLNLGDRYLKKNLCGLPWRVALALQDDGWYLRSDIIWEKPNIMPDPVTDRPTKSHEYIFLLTKQAKYFYDADAIREPHKASSLKRYESGLHITTKNNVIKGSLHARLKAGIGNSERMGDFMNPLGRNRRTVWTITTQHYRGAPFVTFPEKLVELMVKAGCPIDGIILDPFCGSGTTGIIAHQFSRRFIGLDLSAEHLQLTQQRLSLNTTDAN